MPPSPQRTSPYRRQKLLVERLVLTHERQRTLSTSSGSGSASNAGATTKGKASERSNKRPFASISAPDAAQSPLVPEQVKSYPRDDKNDVDVMLYSESVEFIDEWETWEEISNIIPSLPYGEESNKLLIALLGFGCSDLGGNDTHFWGATKIDDETEIQYQGQNALSNLARALERMMQTRSTMRQGERRNFNQSSAALNQKFIKKEHEQWTTELTSIEILPWNVLLRISIRMTSIVTNQLLQSSLSKRKSFRKVSIVQLKESTELNVNKATFTSSTSSSKSPIKCTGNSTIDIGDDETTQFHISVINSLSQILDIAIADLRVLSKTQSHQRQETHATKSKNETTFQATQSAQKHPPSQNQITQQKQQLPIDRMFHDWRDQRNMHASVVRDVWGPSRYSFLKDIDLISTLMVEDVMIEKDNRSGGSDLSIIIEEWNEKVNVLVTSLDEFIRAQAGHNLGHDQLQHPQMLLGSSPSLLRYGTKANSPSKSPSMAVITRAHIERVGSRINSDTNSGRKGSGLSFNLNCPDLNTISVNLQTVLDTERNSPSSKSDDANELEEAYHMAIAVGSARRGDNARETIERRLEILVHKLNDEKSNDANRATSVNIDGAGAYLESLLRTLVQPSDPNIWMRLLEESGGKETPMMLRRGRTLLVSFLIGIQAPGWKLANIRLEPSPLPSYLGYLSSRDDFEACRAIKNVQQHAMMDRSSYFLPAVERGQKAIPPSPIVTEVGLSLCMKNFLHKDTPERLDASSCQLFSRSSTGANLFRKYGPLHFSESAHDQLLASIQRPLPHINELANDLFDLILRLAANDDSEQEEMSIPLRLLIPSTSQSLAIVLRAVSDHLDWISPIRISNKYRFILQHIIQTFQCYEMSSLHDLRIEDCPETDDDGFTVWSRRASFVIDTTTVKCRSRIALSTTQLMALLCSRSNTKKQHFPISSLCPGLQPNHFWSEIEKNAVDVPSNLMARILDLNFAVRYLLPLSYQCALFLAASSLPSLQIEKSSGKSHGCESLPSLVATLHSLLDVLAKHELLHDCIHVGWSIQLFALSVSYFVFGEDFHWRERESKTLNDWDFTSDSIWEHLSYELNRLYCTVWGKDWQMCSRSLVSGSKCIYYESIGRGSNGVAMLVLMPSFDIFIASLIEFFCRFHSPAESKGVKGFCQFIANVLFDRYANVHKVCPYPKSGYYEVDYPRHHEFSLVFGWIDTVSSKLQEIIFARLFSGSNVNKKYGKAEEASTTKALTELITPVLKCLHKHIMRRVLRSTARSSPEFVASGFVRLYKQEAANFLTKPSPEKTRKWNIYRKCLEAVFTLTAPDVLFTCPCYLALTDHATETLAEIWNQYGECDLSHSISIMIAASLLVGASTSSSTRDSSLLRQNGLLLHTKQLYSNFSSCAKSCIMSTLHANSQTEQSLGEFRKHVNYLIRSVQRELSLRGGTDIALEWWNEVSVEVLALLPARSK